MTIEVKELRSGQRYVLDTPLPASFGATEVQIVNISTGGVQIIHPLPQRIGSASRLHFRVGDITVSTTARMLWSHLSKTPNTGGQMTYQSGLRIDDPEFAASVQALVERGFVNVDSDSLDRKRKRLIEKERERSDKHLLRTLPGTEPSISSEQLLLIQHARERLKANSAEAARLYHIARTADAAKDVREDVLAVWEYLERSIPLATITRVFEAK
ncbi:MAG: hypothetical protein DMF56_05735 [Acidobacteria bacterium]|nr:MAG: hypothetical protein DMF56_05735 [Acidobacteriota bacterium]